MEIIIILQHSELRTRVTMLAATSPNTIGPKQSNLSVRYHCTRDIKLAKKKSEIKTVIKIKFTLLLILFWKS